MINVPFSYSQDGANGMKYLQLHFLSLVFELKDVLSVHIYLPSLRVLEGQNFFELCFGEISLNCRVEILACTLTTRVTGLFHTLSITDPFLLEVAGCVLSPVYY